MQLDTTVAVLKMQRIVVNILLYMIALLLMQAAVNDAFVAYNLILSINPCFWSTSSLNFNSGEK